MKNILTFILFISSFCLFAQQAKEEVTDTSKVVTIIIKFDEPKMACKDGYAINEYIVNISFDQAKKLDGKKIEITGSYTIVKGLENETKEYDLNGNEIMMQGRLGDSKHIEMPVIKVIEK